MDARGLLVGMAGGVIGLWLVLLVALVVLRPERATLGAVLRMLPDLVRLLHRLARDSTVPRRVRVRLWLLLAYLASPLDLVPDAIPVLGYADDAILVVTVLRSVVRLAGPDALGRHWTGSSDGLAALIRLAGPAPRVA